MRIVERLLIDGRRYRFEFIDDERFVVSQLSWFRRRPTEIASGLFSERGDVVVDAGELGPHVMRALRIACRSLE